MEVSLTGGARRMNKNYKGKKHKLNKIKFMVVILLKNKENRREIIANYIQQACAEKSNIN